jgi:ABC-type sugar transport system ATPase subunit
MRAVGSLFWRVSDGRRIDRIRILTAARFNEPTIPRPSSLLTGRSTVVVRIRRVTDGARIIVVGAKLRFEIARALQHRPRILFLDEPTSGLDPQSRNQIWEFIRGLSRDEHVTVFFTTHYMEEAERVADRIAVINHGRIVAEGTAAALREETGGRTLEDAFIALTGHSIREAESPPVDRMAVLKDRGIATRRSTREPRKASSRLPRRRRS